MGQVMGITPEHMVPSSEHMGLGRHVLIGEGCQVHWALEFCGWPRTPSRSIPEKQLFLCHLEKTILVCQPVSEVVLSKQTVVQ